MKRLVVCGLLALVWGSAPLGAQESPEDLKRIPPVVKEHIPLSASGETQQLWRLDRETVVEAKGGGEIRGIPVYAEELPKKAYGLKPLTDAAFRALPKAVRYKVANKLYATLFYGEDAARLKKDIASDTFMSDTFKRFRTPNSAKERRQVEKELENYYDDCCGHGLLSHLMARLYHLSPGKHYFNRWAAYILTQTILFSPAYELDTVYVVDSINVYGRLVRSFDEGESIQWGTYSHMISNENWRRFRSPEDNGREMLEIYLMDFNDSHVPMAATTLKNWHLDRYSGTLVIGVEDNTIPQRHLFPGEKVVTGYDFYSRLTLQPGFLPTVCRRLVDIFFPTFSENRKAGLAKRLAESHPGTWPGLLRQIVFSKVYLLESDKAKSLEETFLPVAKALGWVPTYYSFYRISYMQDYMHQATMRYKLGRKTEVPLDTQSFAWFHKIIREEVMTNYRDDTSAKSDDAGWPLRGIFRKLPKRLIARNEFDKNGKKTLHWYQNETKRAHYIVDSLFLATIGRVAQRDEWRMLTGLIDDLKHDREKYDTPSWLDCYGNETVKEDREDRGYFAGAVLDYLSRLDEIYCYRSLK